MIRNAVKTESVCLSFIHEKWPASQDKSLGQKTVDSAHFTWEIMARNFSKIWKMQAHLKNMWKNIPWILIEMQERIKFLWMLQHWEQDICYKAL